MLRSSISLFLMIIRKLACLNQEKCLSGKSLSISAGGSITIFTIGFVFPFAAPYLSWQPNQTMKLLPWLDLSSDQLLKMEKLNPQSRIDYLDPQIDPVKVFF